MHGSSFNGDCGAGPVRPRRRLRGAGLTRRPSSLDRSWGGRTGDPPRFPRTGRASGGVPDVEPLVGRGPCRFQGVSGAHPPRLRRPESGRRWFRLRPSVTATPTLRPATAPGGEFGVPFRSVDQSVLDALSAPRRECGARDVPRVRATRVRGGAPRARPARSGRGSDATDVRARVAGRRPHRRRPRSGAVAGDDRQARRDRHLPPRGAPAGALPSPTCRPTTGRSSPFRPTDTLDAVWQRATRPSTRCRPTRRPIVRMQHLDGMTHTEISEKLGIALGTVKSRSHRAHRKARNAAGPSPGAAHMTDRLHERRARSVDRERPRRRARGRRSRRLALLADLLGDPSTWAEPTAGLEDSVVAAVLEAPPVTGPAAGADSCRSGPARRPRGAARA